MLDLQVITKNNSNIIAVVIIIVLAISNEKFNPYSKELFSNEKIEIRQKNIFEEISQFEDSFFDRIIHDPPTFKYSPELYSREFLAELYRVLKKGGILYHYCPCPQKTKEKEHSKMLTNLNKNDEVVTSSGIHGTIVNVKDKTIILRIDDNVKMEIEKSAIAYIKKIQGESGQKA